MELERNLPPTLVERMDDEGEIMIFDKWRHLETNEDLSHALAIEARYNEQRSIWRPKNRNNDCRDAVDKYLRNNPVIPGADTQTWEDVMRQLDDAETMYQAKGESSMIRRGMRHGQTISRTMLPLLEAIPNEKGLGLIKGGLLVIFNAMKRRSETCEKIFHCFKSIPQQLAHVHKTARSYPHDMTINKCVDDFHSVLLNSIADLLEILERKKEDVIARVGRALFGDSVDKVDAILLAVKAATENVEHHVEYAERSRNGQTSQRTAEIHQQVEFIRGETHNIKTALLETSTNLQDTIKESKLDITSSVVEAVVASIDKQNIENMEKLREGLNVTIINAFYRMINEANRQRYLADSLNNSHVRNTMILSSPINSELADENPVNHVHNRMINKPSLGFQAKRLSITKDEVLQAIDGYSVIYVANDHSFILRKHHEFDDKALGHAGYLSTMPEFRGWLTIAGSDILLVDGHCAEHSLGKISALSIFCAMLKHSLSTLSLSPDTTVILYFPCGQHTTLDDPLAGPSGLIRILISQLLIGWPKEVLNLEFIEEDQSLWSLIQEGHITALCQLFNQLLEKLPQAVVVYCIIDGISEYETRSWGWEADANLVVECLRDTVLQLQDPMHRCCTFKALLASAHKSSSVYKIIPARSRVELRAGNNHSHSMLDNLLEEDIANTLRQWDTSDTLYVEE